VVEPQAEVCCAEICFPGASEVAPVILTASSRLFPYLDLFFGVDAKPAQRTQRAEGICPKGKSHRR